MAADALTRAYLDATHPMDSEPLDRGPIPQPSSARGPREVPRQPDRGRSAGPVGEGVVQRVVIPTDPRHKEFGRPPSLPPACTLGADSLTRWLGGVWEAYRQRRKFPGTQRGRRALGRGMAPCLHPHRVLLHEISPGSSKSTEVKASVMITKYICMYAAAFWPVFRGNCDSGGLRRGMSAQARAFGVTKHEARLLIERGPAP